MPVTGDTAPSVSRRSAAAAGSGARGAPRPQWRQWRAAAAGGALLVLGGNGLVTWAEQDVPSGMAALIVATVPLWITLLEWLLYRRAGPAARTVAGLLLGSVGIGLLVGPGLFQDPTAAGPASWLIMLLAPVLWSLGSLRARQANLPRNTFMATAMEMLAGGLLLLLAGLGTGEAARLELARIAPRSVLAMLYLTLFGSLVAFTAYVWLLQTVPPTRVATYTYVNPVIALFLGALLLQESVTPPMLLAVILIVGAVILITTRTAAGPGGRAQPLAPATAAPSSGAGRSN